MNGLKVIQLHFIGKPTRNYSYGEFQIYNLLLKMVSTSL